MPYKLPFRVVSVTSEEDLFPSTELNHHSPSTRGWISSRSCSYPQEVILALRNRARMCKIQVLSHQYLIASKIEFYIGEAPEDDVNHFENAKYTKLGYVVLSDNLNTDFRVRELKSVHVDASGSFVRLLLHKSYANRLNNYDQVGIIAINLLGIFTDKSNNEKATGSLIQKNPDFIPPTEDLAFDIYQDPEVANIIRSLEKQKEVMVLQERFDQAQKIRDAITALQRIGERLGRLAMEKQQAVEVENYECAKQKKLEMEEQRAIMYREFDLSNLLSSRPEEKEANDKEQTNDNSTTKPVSYRSSIRGRPEPIHLETLNELGALTQDGDEYGGEDSNSYDKPIEQYRLGLYDRLSAAADPDDRPLPALAKRQQKNNNAFVMDDDDLSEQHSEVSADVRIVESRLPPGHYSLDEPSEVHEDQTEFGELIPDDESLSTDIPNLPEPLSEEQRRQASVAIDVVGIDLVTKALSKNWSFREKALVELEKRVTALKLPPPVSAPNGADADPRAELRSTTFLLKRLLNDPVLSIFRLACYLMEKIVIDFAERYDIPRPELYYCLDKLVPVLIQRVGDASPKIREVAKAQILSTARWPQVRQNSTFWAELVRPFSSVALNRLALGRLELVTELYASRGADPPVADQTHAQSHTGFTAEALANFTTRALTHRSIEVREGAENLIVALYRAEDRAVIRHALPLDDNNAHTHPMYRRIFAKFERIDNKSGSPKDESEVPVSDVQKKRKQVEALQAEVERLRAMMENGSTGSTLQPPEAAGRMRQVRYISPKSKANKSPRYKLNPMSKRQDPTESSADSTKGSSILRSHSAQLTSEAELLLNLDKTCIFCGEQNDKFTEEGLDLHYWKDCPMLHRCANCKQVVEIASVTEHLLKECEAIPAGRYVLCSRCSEAIPAAEMRTHPCIPAAPGRLRCPLCHTNLPTPDPGSVAPGGPEDIWKSHLLGIGPPNIPVCPNNPRHPMVPQRAHCIIPQTRSPRNNVTSQPTSQVASVKRKTGIPRPVHAKPVRLA
ncbi:unnamed protein product [Calicophoron daubneyi]|uniref:UVR domain-containing protein n=1 Tax=Calicophoron daubneyi TaxID=300641 RepID=A0AAV2TYU6_CALDB